MKKVIATVLSICLVLTMTIQAFALTDTYIFRDDVINTYVGQTEANDMIKNLNFTDTSVNNYGESIARMGAFDIVKGYSNKYNPGGFVSNQEAIAFLIRSLGLEKKAQQNAVALQATNPNSPLLNLWSFGYLQEASNLGIITPQQYQEAINPDQASLGSTAFKRANNAKREDVAQWIFNMENVYSPNQFPITADMQKIYTYSDFENISADRVEAVEAVTANGIMNQNTKTFNPKGTVNRAEMANILSNLDLIYLTQNNLTKKTGTVGGIKIDNEVNTGNQNATLTQFYIRNYEGQIDVIQKLAYSSNISPQIQTKDVPVYKNGKLYGLSALAEGDQIEYIVETIPMKNANELTCYYINVVNPKLTTSTVFGKLESVDPDNSRITIRDYTTNETKTYYTAQNIFGKDDNNNPYLIMNQNKYQVSKLPYGSGVNLNLSNNIVASINYVGEPTIITEERGIVVENNPNFGYMVVYTNSGAKKTYNYDTGSLITVKKLEDYQTEDSVGYIDQVFKSGNYNPVNSTIDKIEAGDIVSIRPKKDDKTYIESIFASTNYTTKYGQILSFTDSGEIITMLVSFDNGTQSQYQMPSHTVITKEGKMSNTAEMKVGDYAKLLVNTAIISPGHVIETVKEVALEGNATHITKIVKGQVAGVDNIQGTMQVQNAQVLQKTGWLNYKQIDTYALKDKNIEIFYKGNRIDLDYANKYLKRGNNEAYIALENSYSGEKVKRISIYDGRDTFIPADTIVSANNGTFMLANNYQNITTDNGTIVVKNGRLVSPQNISAHDYGQVSLNGGNHAGVVNIINKADTSGIMVSRGRIQSVDDGKTFTVQSMVTLTDGSWVITPIERTFNIDNHTLFLDSSGAQRSIDTFLDYTADSVYGQVFNIVSNGTTASYVIEAPYSKQTARGTVYKVEGDNIFLKDAQYLNQNNNTWKVVSRENNTIQLTTVPNTIIIKDNQKVPASKVQIGDQVQFYTDKLDYNNMTAGMAITGYIAEVKK